jgi:uncharacterized protein (DUF1697 family)
MPVVISMLRGVNIGPYNRCKMDSLRAVYESLGFQDVQTLLQSGNVVFRTKKKNLPKLASQIEEAVEKKLGFKTEALLRTTAELKDALARNPFATRKNIDPAKFLVLFIGSEPTADAREKVLAIKAEPEELKISGRELYIYYANGLARPKISWMQLVKTLKTSGTGRNWNTVTKLMEMAEKLEAAA